VGDVVRYTRGSKVLGIEPGEYRRVIRVHTQENRLTVEHENGAQQIYDPRRLSGVSVHHEVQREFSMGDRVQFTAPSNDLHVANRALGTIEKINDAGHVQICMDSGHQVQFNIRQHPHLDHGYAVTSHSSQGQTADRVLIHVETDRSELLVNSRFAYVSVSLAQHDAAHLQCARLCHTAGGDLEQIQFLLGHISIQTTERYLGCKQRIQGAVNDQIGIEPPG
jgi:hypothetical protein